MRAARAERTLASDQLRRRPRSWVPGWVATSHWSPTAASPVAATYAPRGRRAGSVHSGLTALKSCASEVGGGRPRASSLGTSRPRRRRAGPLRCWRRATWSAWTCARGPSKPSCPRRCGRARAPRPQHGRGRGAQLMPRTCPPKEAAWRGGAGWVHLGAATPAHAVAAASAQGNAGRAVQVHPDRPQREPRLRHGRGVTHPCGRCTAQRDM